MDAQGRITIGRKERDREKKIILYRWLYEFRVVDVYIVTRLLGISRQACQLFLNDLSTKGLLQEGYLRLIEGRRKLYCLLKPGFDEWSTLESVGNHFSSKTRILNSRLLHHHLCVQHAVLDMIGKGGSFRLADMEAFWEHNLPNEWVRRPDALLVTQRQNAGGESQAVKVVCEFELTAKSRDRIFWMYQTHVQAMRQKKYHAVYLFFGDESLKTRYQAAFREPQWPVLEMDQHRNKTRRVMQGSEQKTIDTTQIKGLQGVFHFNVCAHEAIKGLI